MKKIRQSDKLSKVCYDIRGPVLEEAKRLEEEGHRILKLNIGNPAPFGFEAPDEIIQDVIRNLSNAQGYSDSKGLFSARKVSSWPRPVPMPPKSFTPGSIWRAASRSGACGRFCVTAGSMPMPIY